MRAEKFADIAMVASIGVGALFGGLALKANSEVQAAQQSADNFEIQGNHRVAADWQSYASEQENSRNQALLVTVVAIGGAAVSNPRIRNVL